MAHNGKRFFLVFWNAIVIAVCAYCIIQNGTLLSYPAINVAASISFPLYIFHLNLIVYGVFGAIAFLTILGYGGLIGKKRALVIFNAVAHTLFFLVNGYLEALLIMYAMAALQAMNITAIIAVSVQGALALVGLLGMIVSSKYASALAKGKVAPKNTLRSMEAGYSSGDL